MSRPALRKPRLWLDACHLARILYKACRGPRAALRGVAAQEAESAALMLPVCVFELLASKEQTLIPQRVCRARAALRQVGYYLEVAAAAKGINLSAEAKRLRRAMQRALHAWPMPSAAARSA